MLNRQPTDIKTESEFESEQRKILSVIKKPVSIKRMKSEGVMRMGLADVQQATRDGVVIIDKVCILSYPLNDSRTSPTLKALYLAQEELMMQPEDVEPEQLSSPAKALVQDSTSTEIGVIMNLTDETLATLQAQNRAYLHKIFPELDGVA